MTDRPQFPVALIVYVERDEVLNIHIDTVL